MMTAMKYKHPEWPSWEPVFAFSILHVGPAPSVVTDSLIKGHENTILLQNIMNEFSPFKSYMLSFHTT